MRRIPFVGFDLIEEKILPWLDIIIVFMLLKPVTKKIHTFGG